MPEKKVHWATQLKDENAKLKRKVEELEDDKKELKNELEDVRDDREWEINEAIDKSEKNYRDLLIRLRRHLHLFEDPEKSELETMLRDEGLNPYSTAHR